MASAAKKSLPLIERDISWLSFNERVLMQASRDDVPLLERVKFLAIYSSNLGEFFAVRVSQYRNLIRAGKKTKKELSYNPEKVLSQILDIVKQQQLKFSYIFESEIKPEFHKNKIDLLRRTELDEKELIFVENYFDQYLLPFVQPVLLIGTKVRPFLNNSALYLALQMKEIEPVVGGVQYGIVKIPSDHIDRFIILPDEGKYHKVIYLDDIVRQSISMMFPGYEIIDTYSIKLTRDAELYIDDEFSGDLVAKIKNSLIKRDIGPASRMVYDNTMPKKMLDYLVDLFEIENMDLIPEGRYHNNFDLFGFPSFGRTDLQYQPLPPMDYTPLSNPASIFDEISEEEHLVMFPFHDYESVVRFFEEAAVDPDVTHIKITQYRVAAKSRIMNALMTAAEKGKNVSVFVEVKARFDEEANLKWGEKLEKAGVNVHYSFPGIKVHCKLGLVMRMTEEGMQRYTYLSTGNFHERTAEIYSDFGFFTADERITREVEKLFTIIETKYLPNETFDHLLVGQFNLKETLIQMIQDEITAANAGHPSGILLKINSLQDPEMIEHLYEASRAGVEIKIICRGICCLIPQKKGYSENIKVISIIDRYLEHARVFEFYAGGEEKLYLASADWMTRNLNYRIETAFPIYDSKIKKTIMDVLDIQWSDNSQAYVIDEGQTNQLNKTESISKIQSQIETYYYFKRKLDLLN